MRRTIPPRWPSSSGLTWYTWNPVRGVSWYAATRAVTMIREAPHCVGRWLLMTLRTVLR